MTSELNDIKADKLVDARSESCPGPLLAAKREISKLAKDAIMELLSSDDGTKRDIPLWCKKVGNEYLGCIDEAGYFRLFIRKKR